MVNYKKIIAEKKTIANGLRFRPTIYEFLKTLSNAEKLSIADKIEQLILEDYEKKYK